MKVTIYVNQYVGIRPTGKPVYLVFMLKVIFFILKEVHIYRLKCRIMSILVNKSNNYIQIVEQMEEVRVVFFHSFMMVLSFQHVPI